MKIRMDKKSSKLALATTIVMAIAVIIATPALILYTSNNQAQAYLTGFDAGNIMSDFVMSNKDTMSVNDIQSFLKSKNSCNFTDMATVRYYQNLGYSYNIKDGHVLCMADDTFNGKSAAQIIYQAAQDYTINPQVLIVVLQKEQALITDEWPNSKQYASATGFGCPDTAACDSSYSGLEKQVRSAAAFFREVLDGGWSNYPVGNNYIYYSPNKSCGVSTVYVQNKATSALYRYTPYQPNQAALNAGTGIGDSCSSYGNRNFYNYFTSWFGSTQTTVSTGNVVLPDGIYTIKSSVDNNKAMDLDAGKTDDNAKIQLWSYIDSSDGQKYKFERGSDGYYTITNVSTGKAIGISSSSASAGSRIVQTSNTDTCDVKWALTLDNGQYEIKSSCAGLVLDLPNNSTINGNQLQIWNDTDSANQRWIVTDREDTAVADGIYYIKNSTSSKVIDVSNGSHDNGGRVQIWSQNDSINTQKFKLEKQSDGLYKITNINSGKVLDLSNGNTNNGATIQIWSYNSSSCSQRWDIRKNGNVYNIYSSCATDKAIDIDSGQYNINGAKLHLWTYGNYKSQQFTFSATTPVVEDGVYVASPSSNNNFAIDVIGGSTSENERFHLWSKIASLKNQQFNIQLQDDGYYSIQNVKSWLFMGVKDANYSAGTELTQRLGDGSCSQKWNIYKYNNGYEIVNPCANMALDLSNGTSSNGKKIQIWDRNDTAAQRWTLTHI